ncbi:MAG: preprotein translocase subunit YajC [Bacteroidales bacterium]|nr:preprotein translocase subunit YajC [Bacteroidales bacterium]MDY6075583.1 preprotein translocase subunit YajC [Bacteroidales bacterium]
MNTLSMFLLQAPAQQGNGWSGIIMIVLLFVVFWLFFIRPQNKRQKEAQKFRDALQKGDKVMTIGGIHGKVHEVKETTIVITVDNNVNIEVEKSALVANGTQVGQA